MKLILMYLVVLLMFISFIANKKFYPFSDFYLFSYLKVHPRICAVGFKNDTGQVQYLDNHLYQPLTRIFIHQMCVGFKRQNDFSWLKIIKERLPERFRGKKLLLHIVEYDPKTQVVFKVEDVYEEI